MVEAFKKQCGIISLRDALHEVPVIKKDTDDMPEKSFVPHPSVDVTTFEDIKEPPEDIKDQDLRDTTIQKEERKDLHIRSPLDIGNFIIA